MNELTSRSPIDVEAIRAQFPILQQRVNGRPLVYLDNAATSQKPQRVIDGITHYYKHNNANVHRGVHELSARATDEYERARETLRHFVNAASSKEIIFVRNGTEAINLVASSFCQHMLKAGDEILLTQMEHHANIVPWQMQADRVGATIKIIPMTPQGELNLENLSQLFNERVKIVALTHVSNVLGTINPVKKIIEAAHARGIPVCLDGAQAGPHMAIDVQALDVDFYALSGHKMYGPTGISIVYAKENWLEKLPPYQGGGDMIKTVSFEKTTYNDLPYKFEAGTPNIAGAIGLAEAVRFMESIGVAAIEQHEQALLAAAMQGLQAIEGITFYGTASHKAAVIAFNVGSHHAHDVGTILDHHGVAVRSGHHCTMPLMNYFDVPATVRASFAVFNTLADVEQLLYAVNQVYEVMG